MMEPEFVYPTDLEIAEAELEIAETTARKYGAFARDLEIHANRAEGGRPVQETRLLDRELLAARARYAAALTWVASTATKLIQLERPDITAEETSDEQLQAVRDSQNQPPAEVPETWRLA